MLMAPYSIWKVVSFDSMKGSIIWNENKMWKLTFSYYTYKKLKWHIFSYFEDWKTLNSHLLEMKRRINTALNSTCQTQWVIFCKSSCWKQILPSLSTRFNLNRLEAWINTEGHWSNSPSLSPKIPPLSHYICPTHGDMTKQ